MGFRGERRENNFLPGTGEAAPYITSKLPGRKDHVNCVFYKEKGKKKKRKAMEKKGEENFILFPLKLILRLYLSNRILLNTHPRGDAGTLVTLPSGNLGLMRILEQVHK